MHTSLLISKLKSISLKKTDDATEVLINGKSTHMAEVGTIRDQEELAQFEKRKFYGSFLSSHFENLVVLSGAGTSVGFGGMTMKQLWGEVQVELTPAIFESLCKAIGYIQPDIIFTELEDKDKDLEKLLSRANIAREFVKVHNGTPIDIGALVAKAEKVIREKCNIVAQKEAPHEIFLNKITNRKLKDPRAKLFTLNYDTLFEQAAVQGGFTIIDGFSFSSPRTLNGRYFDYDIIHRENSRIKEEESYVSKVFHLYKPHGSVNWEYNKDSEKIILKENTDCPVMIFPKDSKYENSYEQPFFEMMSRFQQNLRKENVLLICVGFSFGDKHIVTAIKEAVVQNTSFRLLIINRTIRQDDAKFKWFIDRAKVQENVIIVAEDFADFVTNYPTSKIYSEDQDVEPESNEHK